MTTYRTVLIHLHSEAPAQPPLGAPCNGCGVCCALSPCPLGRALTFTLRGPCALLVWHDGDTDSNSAGQYRCGALQAAQARPAPWRTLATWLVQRWIASGQGCDCPSRVAD